jgi:hypothetical protein
MSYVISILAILTAVSWVCLSLPTAQEQQRMVDGLGKSTGVNWR